MAIMKQRQRSRGRQDITYEPLEFKNSSDEDTELFVRKAQYKEVPTVDIVVKGDDSLQALCVRYQCPVFELKRLNNIHSENEIFARKTIKVPLKPFTMALASVHGSGTNSPTENVASTSSTQEIDSNLLKSKLSSQLLCSPISNSDSKSNDSATQVVNEVIFNSNIKPSPKICDSVVQNPIVNEKDEEHISLLPASVLPEETVVTKISCSGADADISWIALIVCIVVLIVALPLIYVFYIYEYPEKYHHENS